MNNTMTTPIVVVSLINHANSVWIWLAYSSLLVILENNL